MEQNQIMISYYYQVRNLESNMIPVSTSISDPAWFHFNRGKDFQGLDRRGIWNGIRCEKLNPQFVYCSDGGCLNCDHSHPESCQFITGYQSWLESLDFNELISDFNRLCSWAKDFLKIENPIIVLMCHEADWNPCSERVKLIEWFNKNGYQLKLFKKEKK